MRPEWPATMGGTGQRGAEKSVRGIGLRRTGLVDRAGLSVIMRVRVLSDDLWERAIRDVEDKGNCKCRQEPWRN